MPEYDVTWKLSDVIVNRSIVADNLDEALAKARKMETPLAIFQPKIKVDWIDGEIAVKGVYEL